MVDPTYLGCLLCRWYTHLFVHYGCDCYRVGYLGNPKLYYGGSEQIVGL